MFALLEKYRAWRLWRFLRRWEVKRVKGKWHYVPGFALYFSLIIAGSYTFVSLVFDEPVNIFGVTVRLILSFLLGLLLGQYVWRASEKSFLARVPEDENSEPYYPWGEEQAADPEKFEEQFRRDWQLMPHREVVDLKNLNKSKVDMIGADVGQVISATISLVPEKYVHGLYFWDEYCPLCLTSTVSTDRLATSLHPRFEKIENISFCVWVHKQCFEGLPLRDDKPGVPW